MIKKHTRECAVMVNNPCDCEGRTYKNDLTKANKRVAELEIVMEQAAQDLWAILGREALDLPRLAAKEAIPQVVENLKLAITPKEDK